MNFYESTHFGLRVTLYDLSSIRYDHINIRLVPMVHIGEERYYKEVELSLLKSDIILYEGLKMKNFNLNKNNRILLAKRLGLVTQNKLNLKQFKNRLRHADLDEQLSKKKWKELPIYDRLKSSIFIPIYVYFQDRTLTRRKFVKYFMKSNTDLDQVNGPMFDKKERLKTFYYKEREKVLFDEIDKLLNDSTVETKLISNVYGAGHMQSIFRYLSSKYDYRALKGEFIDVFST